MRLYRRFHFLAAFFILTLLGPAAAAVNRTIDDTYGDSVTKNRPVYLPTTLGVWEDARCKECTLVPDQHSAFQESWTAASYHPAKSESMFIELSFKGTAIYIYFILVNSQGWATTACDFILDNRAAGSFVHHPSLADPDFIYHALVFSRTDLPNDDHKLVVSVTGDDVVFINFDYAIYTVEDPPTPTVSFTSPPNASRVVTTVTTVVTSTSARQPDAIAPTTLKNSSSSILSSSILSSSSVSSPSSVFSSSISPSFTTQESKTSGIPNSNNANTESRFTMPAVIGVVGGVVILLALVVLVLFLRRKKRSSAIKVSTAQHTPFFIDGGYSDGSGVELLDSPPEQVQHVGLETHSEFLQTGTIRSSSHIDGRESMMHNYPWGNDHLNLAIELVRPRTASSDDMDAADVRAQVRLVHEELERLKMQQQQQQRDRA
ncbi:hypothetical protein D9615_001526 [Tricholomella constricta]|uniref:Uncharacterized protein n=1 Tax=Tricholomella constricta TaxID=117010 RepID=A0A8H5HPZ7_9AGAR|nr:hypothetical protein D9615_001526 [Tricholomella constricta]